MLEIIINDVTGKMNWKEYDIPVDEDDTSTASEPEVEYETGREQVSLLVEPNTLKISSEEALEWIASNEAPKVIDVKQIELWNNIFGKARVLFHSAVIEELTKIRKLDYKPENRLKVEAEIGDSVQSGYLIVASIDPQPQYMRNWK